MKLRKVILIIALIIFADQALKIWIKTSYGYGNTGITGLNWFQLYFIENKGMAWGWEFGGEWGKMILTLFRLVAVIFGTWYIAKIARKHYSRGFIICAALIYAGALGNLIDSMFYGMIFSHSDYGVVASAFPSEGGYAGFLHGKVVDMLYFPIIRNAEFPSWFPFVGENEKFEFFSPIFNIADASISVGVITLLLFQKRFFKKHKEENKPTVVTSAEVSDKVQVF
ncbi:MAG TPA: lipoprotein signal peptidase [Chitinophagaceae bacterium]